VCIDKDDILLKVASNIEVLMATQLIIKDDLCYLTKMKNKHEDRLSVVEKLIPNKLDERLRNLELKTYLISVIVPIVVSMFMFYLQKLILGN